MKPGTPGFIAERLREAREARGLTSASLAAVLGVSAAAITQYESGAQTPRPEVMDRIVDTLRLPLSFFLETPRRSAGVVFWRSLESARKSARAMGERRLLWLQDITNKIREHVDLQPYGVPIIDVPSDPTLITGWMIEEIAAECRKHWRIGDGPIANVANLLEKNGVVLARDDLQNRELDAVSRWCPEEKRAFCLVSSTKGSAVRSRYNLLHELGHLVIHRNLDRWHIENRQLHRIIEAQAFKFAAELALPTESFAADVYSFSLDAFASIKAKWKVSVGVMVKRCEDLGILREEAAQKLWRSMATRGWKTQEPLDDELVQEEPMMLSQASDYLLSANVVTLASVEDYFRLSLKDVQELTGNRFGEPTEAPLSNLVSMISRPTDESKRAALGGKVIRFDKQGKIGF